jgi:hypothetical protein
MRGVIADDADFADEKNQRMRREGRPALSCIPGFLIPSLLVLSSLLIREIWIICG